ncbi:hypothetical protein HK100_009031, partial [Physocladia obscura]
MVKFAQEIFHCSMTEPKQLFPQQLQLQQQQQQEKEKEKEKRQTRHAIHGVYHGQFTKQDFKPDTGLPAHVRQAIIDCSYLRTPGYDPEHTTTRTELKYQSRNTSATSHLKARRAADVSRCGFCSDPKESYKSLGEPIVDSDILIYKSLKIDPESVLRIKNDKNQDGSGRSADVTS